jgi:hypothetical protein
MFFKLMVGYFINVYFINGYLVVNYFINGYWWLVTLLMAIGGWLLY